MFAHSLIQSREERGDGARDAKDGEYLQQLSACVTPRE